MLTQLLPYASLRFAEHFGHVCRAIYTGETWEACVMDLRRTWNALAPQLSWDEALSHVRTAWDEAENDPSLADCPL
jgi:hypothetical protein